MAEAQLRKEMKNDKQARAKVRETKVNPELMIVNSAIILAIVNVLFFNFEIVADENERWEQMFMANHKSKEILTLQSKLEEAKKEAKLTKQRIKKKRKKREKQKEKSKRNK